MIKRFFAICTFVYAASLFTASAEAQGQATGTSGADPEERIRISLTDWFHGETVTTDPTHAFMCLVTERNLVENCWAFVQKGPSLELAGPRTQVFKPVNTVEKTITAAQRADIVVALGRWGTQKRTVSFQHAIHLVDEVATAAGMKTPADKNVLPGTYMRELASLNNAPAAPTGLRFVR